MKSNIGNTDCTIRVLLAVIISMLYFTNIITGTIAYILLAIGGIFLLTGLVGSCPLYSLFGINACRVKK